MNIFLRNYIVMILSGLLSVFLLSCGSSGVGSDSKNSSTVSAEDTTPVQSKKYLAKNIVFKSISFTKEAYAGEIDTTTKVTAENVIVENEDNALSSDNLQSALDNELAIDLSKLLPETTWTITNKTSDSTYKDSIGEVTFSTSTFSLTGKFAAAGLYKGETCILTTPYSYEMLNNSIMYVTWSDDCGSGRSYDRSSVITIVANNRHQITLLGFGGYGVVGTGRISTLTKVDQNENNEDN